jgi:hypothetical protein
VVKDLPFVEAIVIGRFPERFIGAAGAPHRPERHQLQHHRAPHREDDGNWSRDAERQARDAREHQRVAGQRHERTVGEIDHAENREDDGEAERQQRVGAAEAERIHGLLDEVVHDAATSAPR